MIYYVSTEGNDGFEGSKNRPFKTINRAAEVAVSGDTVRVFGGVYREWVDPKFGGTSEQSPIIYEAVEGEHPIITGSEIITDWERVESSVWKRDIPNKFFGDFNPFKEELGGDWFVEPVTDYRVHSGDLYINGVSAFEAKSMEDLYDTTPRKVLWQNDMRIGDELILHPELSIYKWYATVTEQTTTIFCNFGEYNPNEQVIEINVRPCCFYPKATGINYITLRGFEICNAACPWTPPTSDQIGMVGPHWSKGWVIENNKLHDAKCSAISLGKEKSTGHNFASKYAKKSGHRHQLEAVFSALQKGWRKELIGSHTVRNNEIYDCGQNGIVGHLGCIFSKIEHNHIYNIGVKHEFWGHEMAGIKFHGAIDTFISNNNIHNCTLGIWLDWQAQGSRVTANLLYENSRDIMVEVTHGPYVLDHNIFLSEYTFDNWAQGGAFIHNIFCGKVSNRSVMERSTPYHFPHSTIVAGYSEIYGGDDRYYNNIFSGSYKEGGENLEQFTKNCDKYTLPEEYKSELLKPPVWDIEKITNIPQPVWLEGNAYFENAAASVNEASPFVFKENLGIKVIKDNGEWRIKLTVPSAFLKTICKKATTLKLGEPRIAAMPFEASDGGEINFSRDITNAKHGEALLPGPFAELKAGTQEILVWKNKR